MKDLSMKQNSQFCPFIDVAGRRIGPGSACFVIAEAGVNHNGDMALAHRLVDAAKAAGADAVKFQAFVTEELVTAHAPKADYQKVLTGADNRQFQMLKALELSAEQQGEIKAHCDRIGIAYLCTPYDYPSAKMLDELDVAAFKIASTDTTNTPFLAYLAQFKRPVILSTGLSTLAEVEAAVGSLAEATGKLALLHCTSEYPAPPEQANLRAMKTLARAFGVPTGFSDHTAGIGLSPAAVAAGACMLEKHFTLDRNLPGPDHQASVEPSELAELLRQVRLTELALGDGIKRQMPCEGGNKQRMQKSLVARRDLRAGHVLTDADLVCKRPATGLAPSYWTQVVGKRAAKNVAADSVLTLSCIDWTE
ncbi:N,N'-diacetyllegionaminic acid synthase [Rhodospirillaceae bacterium LM-1]|nr:N,N'-diacetyllegionaminic acid synthase [Rhodospirillaceae bacterium LM-1]